MPAAAVPTAAVKTAAAPAANMGAMYFNPIRMVELPFDGLSAFAPRGSRVSEFDGVTADTR